MGQNQREVNIHTTGYTGQNVTIDDLILFQLQLLNEIKKVLKEHGCDNIKRWLKTDEVKELLGISTNTLTGLRSKQLLPFTKIGGVIYYDYRDIEKMLLENKGYF